MDERTDKELYAAITQEVVEARWIHSLLAGAKRDDPRFEHDRKGARTMLRHRRWELADVSSLAEKIAQGIVQVPGPPQSASNARGRKRGLGDVGGLGSDSGGSWGAEVRSWLFLPRKLPVEYPATDTSRQEWCAKIRRTLNGYPEDGEGWRAPVKRGSIMDGLGVVEMFKVGESPDPWED